MGQIKIEAAKTSAPFDAGQWVWSGTPAQSVEPEARCNMVSQDEVRRLLGELDDEKVAEILKLRPTLQEVELAAVGLDGRTDVLVKAGHHLSGTTAQILEIVLSDEEALQRDR